MLQDVLGIRALRLSVGTAIALAISFSLGFPIPFLPPMITFLLLASRNQALPIKTGLMLMLLAALTTGAGLLLIPAITYFPFTGVLLVILCLFMVFYFSVHGGNSLLTTFIVVGITLISATGATAFSIALTVIEALVKGILLATLTVMFSHWLFPEINYKPTTPPKKVAPNQASWIALRAVLVVMPAFLLAVINPSSYVPLVLKSANLGQQVCSTSARSAGKELIGSTLLGGFLAIIIWSFLTIFPHIWMFFLWVLFFLLLISRRMYRLVANKQTSSFWASSATTMIILLGQSVQDSNSGKDVYAAFAIRISLFLTVAIYAYVAVHIMDKKHFKRLTQTTH